MSGALNASAPRLRLLEWRPMQVIYSPILKWRSRELQDGFSTAVVQAVEVQHGPIS